MIINIDESSEPSGEVIQLFYVDIPTRDLIGNPEGSWTNLATFFSRTEAVKFIREHIGPCDDEGRIGLITVGEHDKSGL